MSVIGAGSTQRNRQNPDGSKNIYCSYCHDFIGYSFENIIRAICVLCQRALDGKPLDEEAIRVYKLSKANRVDVSSLLVPQEPPVLSAMGIKRKFNLTDLAGDMLRAVGRFAQSEASVAEPEKLESVKVAKSKRRPRLFENMTLGTMEDVDKAAGPGGQI